MNEFYKVKSGLYFLRNLIFWIFIFLVGFILGLNVGDVKAASNPTFNIDFSKYEDPWNLNNSYDIPYEFSYGIDTLPYIHITISGEELHVYAYKKPLSIDENDSLSCENQIFYLLKYRYDVNQDKFTRSGNQSSFYTTTSNDGLVIYSNYDFIKPFPNLDYLYNNIRGRFSSSLYGLDNLNHFISKWNELQSNRTMILLGNDEGNIFILFNQILDSNIVGDGNGISGGGFNWRGRKEGNFNLLGTYGYGIVSDFKNYKSCDFYNEDCSSVIDSYIDEISTAINSNSYNNNGSLGSYAPSNNYGLIYYSMMGPDGVEILNNTYGQLEYNERKYNDFIPALYNDLYEEDKYVFDENIDLTVENPPSRIIFHFDDVPSFNNYINYFYGIHHRYISPPYIKRKNVQVDGEDLRSDTIPLSSYCTSGESCMGEYLGTVEVSYKSVGNRYDLIVDFPRSDLLPEGRRNPRLFIGSKIPFTYEYEYNSSNLTELDFTNKYGVLLAPKNKKDCSDEYYEDFYTSVYLTLQEYDIDEASLFQFVRYNPDTKKFTILSEPDDYININEWTGGIPTFQYSFKGSASISMNDFLLIRNPSYMTNPKALLLFDSNYFEYQILDTEFDKINLINPNTCELIDGDIPPAHIEDDDSNYIEYFFKKIDDIFDKTKEVANLFSRFFDILFVGEFQYILIACLFVFVIVLITSSFRR